MENNIEELVKKVENNLRFIITITIFFLSIFPEIRLEGCVLIVAYIFNYIAFEVRVKNLIEENLRWIKNLLYIAISSYVIPLTVVALSTQKTTIGSLEFLTFKAGIITSMVGIMFIPTIILIVIVFSSNKTLSDFKKDLLKIKATIKEKISKTKLWSRH
jgi:hypothetical protein